MTPIVLTKPEHLVYENSTSPTMTSPYCKDAMCIFFCVLNVTILIVGFTGNGLVIWIAGFKIKKSVISTWYLSMAVSDFLFCSFLPFDIIYKVKNEWIFGRFMCKLRYFIMFLNLYSSIFILTVITVDRCVVVRFPVWAQNHRSVRKASAIVTLAWIISAALKLPAAIFRDVERKHCSDSYKNNHDHFTSVTFRVVLGFVVLFHIIVLCYVVIIRKLKSNQKLKYKKAIKIMTAVIVAFLICWVPFHIFSFLEIKYKNLNHVINMGKLYAITLANANSSLNPLLYAFMGKDIKKQCSALLLKIENAVQEEEGQDTARVRVTSDIGKPSPAV